MRIQKVLILSTGEEMLLNNGLLVSQGLRERIEDLGKQIDLMSDQLGKKDDQISQLNEVTQKQAVHIQSLIQEILTVVHPI